MEHQQKLKTFHYLKQIMAVTNMGGRGEDGVNPLKKICDKNLFFTDKNL